MKPLKEFALDYMEQLQHALDHINLDKIQEAAQLIANCRGTIWLIGNGGSAALASHMATDLQLAGKRAVALTDVAAVTTYANDDGQEWMFTKQLAALTKKEDILIAISGSGNSKNITHAVPFFEGKVISIIGFDGGLLKEITNKVDEDVTIHVPAQHMGVSQDGHSVVLHIICYWLMQRRQLQ